MIHQLEPELEVIARCDAADDEAQTKLVAALRKVVDWDRMLKETVRHGVLPLLATSLESVSTGPVPEDFLRQLRALNRANSHRNLRRVGHLLRVSRLLRENGVPCLPYKGPMLAQYVYGDYTRRQFADLDILVQPSHAAQSLEVLRAAGYHTRTGPADTREMNWLLTTGSSVATYSTQDGTRIQLHWAVLSRRYGRDLSVERLWRRSIPLPIAGSTLPALSPEDLFILLSVHSSKHYWQKMEYVHCIGSLVTAHPELDWAQVLEQAQELGCRRRCLLGVNLARVLTGAHLPGTLLAAATKDRTVAALTTKVIDRFSAEDTAPHPRAAHHLWQMRTLDSTRQRVLYLLEPLFTQSPEDWATFPALRHAPLLYYAIRPLRLLGKYGARFVRASE